MSQPDPVVASAQRAALHRRLLRRETHRSRSTAASAALLLLALPVAYLGTEAALALFGMPPLLLAPEALLAGLADPDATVRPYVGLAAALLVVLGLVAVVLAVVPGRRARHALADERIALLVDDDVLAGALSRGAAATASIGRSQVSTAVSTRRARVSVQPSSGFPVAAAEVRATAEGLLESLSPRPSLRVDVAVADRGVVGA